MNPLESYEPVSRSGAERPWEAYDSQPIGRSRVKPTPITDREFDLMAPDTEQDPSTQRSSERSDVHPRVTPQSRPTESGERTTRKQITVTSDLGMEDRKGEPVSGDRTKAPFTSSVIESDDDEEAAA